MGRRTLPFAVVVALVGVSMPQPAGVDAPVWATPWTATVGVPSGTVGIAWNSYANTVVNDGGVDFGWHFSDGNSTLAAYVGGRNGSYTNAPTYNQAGAQGGTDKAVTFDDAQSEYAMVPHDNQFSMNNTQAYSLEIIFKLGTLPATGNPRLISKEQLYSSSGGYALAYNGNDNANKGQVYCGRYPGSTGGGAPAYVGSNGYQLTAGQWVHLVCTFDGSTMRFYWNGELRDTAAASGNIQNNVENLYIGALGGTQQYVDGTIDEVGLYWNALSQREVKSHYYAMLAQLP